MQPQKIFELKTKDWMKGLSIQSDYAVGGLFSIAINFNPFEKMGYMKPSLSPAIIDATTITTQIKQFASFKNGADGYVFGIGDRSGTGTKCLYRVNLTDSTVIDYSSAIDQNATTGSITHGGLTTFKGRLIYEQGGSLRSNTFVPLAGNDVGILGSALSGGSDTPIIFAQGSDGNLYYTANAGSSIGKVVLVSGTTGNVANAFQMTDTSLVPKDICNDGIYTIFIADNNSTKVSTANVVCRIFFWDTIKSKADIIFDIPDSYLISCRYVNGKVYVLGGSGLWVCNSATPPKLIFPLDSSKLPASASAVTQNGNFLYWGAGSIGARIYGYGATVGNPILFNPYVASGGSDLIVALASSGTYLVSSTDLPKAYLLNSGSTRSNATFQTATTPLPVPYQLSYVKISLSAPLSSGQEVYMNISNGNSGVISDTVSKAFSVVGAKQTLKFEVTSAVNNFKTFEEFVLTVSAIAGATIQRITVYGIPLEDNSQLI